MLNKLSMDMFKEELDDCRDLIERGWPEATEHGINLYFNKWWENKRHIINMFGGQTRINIPLNTATQGHEEGSTNNIADSFITILDRHLASPISLSYKESRRVMNNHDGYFVDSLTGYIPVYDHEVIDNYEPFRKFYQTLRTAYLPDKPLFLSEYDTKCQHKDIFFCNSQGVRFNLRKLVKLLFDEGHIDLTTNTVFGIKVIKFFKGIIGMDSVNYTFENCWSMFMSEYKKGKGNIVASVSPIDYLLMSESSNFSSCARINRNESEDCCDTGGEFLTSGFSYMIDDCTIMGYKPCDYDMEVFNRQVPDKSWRTLAYFDRCNASVLFTRNYPRFNESYFKYFRHLIMHTLADHYNIEPTWTIGSGDSNCSINNDVMDYVYPDWEHEDHYDVSHARRCKFKDGFSSDPAIEIGAIVHCINCHGTIDSRDKILCESCITDHYHQCSHCENYFQEGAYNFDTDLCLRCNAVHAASCVVCDNNCDRTYIHRVSYNTEHSNTAEVCSTCIEGMLLCLDCGEYILSGYEHDVEDGDVCTECFDNNYTECEECNFVFSNANNFNYLDTICDDCRERMEEADAS